VQCSHRPTVPAQKSRKRGLQREPGEAVIGLNSEVTLTDDTRLEKFDALKLIPPMSPIVRSLFRGTIDQNRFLVWSNGRQFKKQLQRQEPCLECE
jgi:hypothetical protein